MLQDLKIESIKDLDLNTYFWPVARKYSSFSEFWTWLIQGYCDFFQFHECLGVVSALFQVFCAIIFVPYLVLRQVITGVWVPHH